MIDAPQVPAPRPAVLTAAVSVAGVDAADEVTCSQFSGQFGLAVILVLTEIGSEIPLLVICTISEAGPVWFS